MITPHAAARTAVSLSTKRPATAVLLDIPDARLVVFRLLPGQSVPVHSNASTVMLTVLGGTGVLSGAVNGEPCERECAAGDMAVYDPNEPHGMRAGATDEFLLLATITPRPGARTGTD